MKLYDGMYKKKFTNIYPQECNQNQFISIDNNIKPSSSKL